MIFFRSKLKNQRGVVVFFSCWGLRFLWPVTRFRNTWWILFMGIEECRSSESRNERQRNLSFSSSWPRQYPRLRWVWWKWRLRRWLGMRRRVNSTARILGSNRWMVRKYFFFCFAASFWSAIYWCRKEHVLSVFTLNNLNMRILRSLVEPLAIFFFVIPVSLDEAALNRMGVDFCLHFKTHSAVNCDIVLDQICFCTLLIFYYHKPNHYYHQYVLQFNFLVSFDLFPSVYALWVCEQDLALTSQDARLMIITIGHR